MIFTKSVVDTNLVVFIISVCVIAFFALAFIILAVFYFKTKKKCILNKIDDDEIEKEIKENIAFMKEKGLDMDIFINHASMMLDKELKDKVTLLLSIGKDKLDLYLNPSILIKYDLNTLKNVIARIKENQMDPKDVPLMAY